MKLCVCFVLENWQYDKQYSLDYGYMEMGWVGLVYNMLWVGLGLYFGGLGWVSKSWPMSMSVLSYIMRYVYPAHCRCRPSTGQRLHWLVTFAVLLTIFLNNTRKTRLYFYWLTWLKTLSLQMWSIGHQRTVNISTASSKYAIATCIGDSDLLSSVQIWTILHFGWYCFLLCPKIKIFDSSELLCLLTKFGKNLEELSLVNPNILFWYLFEFRNDKCFFWPCSLSRELHNVTCCCGSKSIFIWNPYAGIFTIQLKILQNNQWSPTPWNYHLLVILN